MATATEWGSNPRYTYPQIRQWNGPSNFNAGEAFHLSGHWTNSSKFYVYMGVLYPQIIHFNRVFHYKPSILGYPYFWKHPYVSCCILGCEIFGWWEIILDTWIYTCDFNMNMTSEWSMEFWNWQSFPRNHRSRAQLLSVFACQRSKTPKDTVCHWCDLCVFSTHVGMMFSDFCYRSVSRAFMERKGPNLIHTFHTVQKLRQCDQWVWKITATVIKRPTRGWDSLFLRN